MQNVQETYSALQHGNRRVLSRCITAAESHLQRDQQAIVELLQLDKDALARQTKRIAISGVPGVGKSTFINAVGSMLADTGSRVAVLAVDPSSTLSGGSILGDKTRMSGLDTHDNVFIRPSPTHGALGGVTHATRTAIQLCEIAGFDTILIETVGVGQSEYSVADMTDMFVTLLLHNAGDDLQALKRGIMEITDLFVLHKVDDKEMQKQAGIAMGLMLSSLQVIRPRRTFWKPKVVSGSSTTGFGVNGIVADIHAFFAAGDATNSIVEARKTQFFAWTKEEMLRTLQDRVEEYFLQPIVSQEVHDQLGAGTHPLHLAQDVVTSFLDQK